MKLFAVIQYFHYEGYRQPECIFSTAKAAQDFADSMKKNNNSLIEIIEYDLDNGASGFPL